MKNGQQGRQIGGDAPSAVMEEVRKTLPACSRQGQTGEFIIEHEGMRVRFDLNGIFGISSSAGFWPASPPTRRCGQAVLEPNQAIAASSAFMPIRRRASCLGNS